MTKNLLESEKFWQTKPFPYIIIDDYLPLDILNCVQNEINGIPQEEFDRYENPFESKYTLRDKETLPPATSTLFELLQSDNFLLFLKNLTGFEVENDPFKHYWGIHLFREGDKLDIHVDAGIHPKCGKKKFITFGLYLSNNYEESFDGQLELWSGDLATKEPVSFIDKKEASVSCYANTAVVFACSDNSWHGAPTRFKGTKETQRIFLTISYLVDQTTEDNIQKLKEVDERFGVTFNNKKTRAYFPAIRDAEETEELASFRLKRASEQAVDLYRQKI